jgi:membrane glycosyltransferase
MWFAPEMRRAYGGSLQFALSFMLEIITSIAYAPILMIQQTVAVIRSLVGYSENWDPQKRNGGEYPLPTLIKFHFVELVFGFALLIGMTNELVSLWLLPIAISLAGSVVLSGISGINLTHLKWGRKQLGTPIEIRVPRVIQSSRQYRTEINDALNIQIAAE